MSPRDSASLLLNVCRCGLAKCNLAGYTRLRALNLYGCRPAQHQNQHFPHCSVWIKKNVRTLASISINICRHQPQDNLVANVSSEGKVSLRFPGRTRIGRSQKKNFTFCAARISCTWSINFNLVHFFAVLGQTLTKFKVLSDRFVENVDTWL